MKRTKISLAVIFVALGIITTQAASGPKAPTLKVGDPAPKLQTGKWVQGEPVTEFQKDKSYLVEFWATWCGPCRVSIPHLNKLHEKYQGKGLVVIGQDCWENNESLVEPFLKEMGEKMTYRVALDDKQGNERGKMAETWMAAAGRNGIPSAFLIDTQGRVAWIGHPMQLKDSVVEAVLDGTFDVNKEAAVYEQQQKNEAAINAIWRDVSAAMKSKNWDEAEAKLGEAEKLIPENSRDNLRFTRFRIAVGKGDHSALHKRAEQISDASPGNAMLQNQLAWMILTDPAIKEPDLNLAEKIATRANNAAEANNPAILDTLARACFMNGKKEQAIELQEKAVKLADRRAKQQLESVLDSYKKGKLPSAQ